MKKTYGIRACGPSSSALVDDALTLYRETSWHSDTTARARHQTAIYKVSECLSCNMLRDQVQHPRLKALGQRMAREVIAAGLVPDDCIPVYAELNILLPSQTVAWHHDRMIRHSVTYRVNLPLTDEPDIDYLFTSWADNTPVGIADFAAVQFRAPDLRVYKLKQGHFHLFNNRIPHSTVSRSPRIRPMLLVDLAPRSKVTSDNFGAKDFAPLTEEERQAITE